MYRRLGRLCAALLLALGAGTVAAAPAAQAVSYRDLKSVRWNLCLYAYSDPVEGIGLNPCSRTPAKYGNWSVTNVGYYNSHALWVLRRQGGSCLGIGGSASSSYPFSTCTAAYSVNVWEVFPTSGRYVLKSFGAWRKWGQHKCLNFPSNSFTGSTRLAGCSLTSTTNQIYR